MTLDPIKRAFIVPLKPTSSAKGVRVQTSANRQAITVAKQPLSAGCLMPTVSTLLLKLRLWIGLSVVVAITGCQPVATDKPATDASLVTSVTGEADSVANNEPSVAAIVPSAAAQSSIDQHEAEFIAKMLALQQGQLTQGAAPLTQSSNSNKGVSSSQTEANSNKANSNEAQASSNQYSDTSKINQATNNNLPKANLTQDISNPTQANQNQVANNPTSSIDLPNATFADLPLLTAPMPPPETLSAAEIQSRYKVAMQSLFLPDTVPLAAGSVDTLLNVATLVPDVFAEPQLATRLVIKMPALARLLKHYQTWQQIEAQQSRELSALKQQQLQAQQQQEKVFNELVAEFDERIKGYDEQIDKYEKKLAEF